MFQPQINNRTILIGRCSYERRVRYLHYWMEKVISEAKRLNFNVIDLNNHDFERNKLIKMLKEKHPFMVILCGHGTKSSIHGHNNKKVIELCNEDYLLKDKIVYAISCYTAKGLSKSARTKGCKCYMGWDNLLVVPARKNTPPEQDDYAQPCMEAIIQIPLSLLYGDDIKTAYKKCYAKFDEWISKWRSNIKFNAMASMLEEIRDHLLVDGN